MSRLLLVSHTGRTYETGAHDCRVMCHGSNTLWPLDEVDPNLVERPVAPGGATGGVEYEAMNYVVSRWDP